MRNNMMIILVVVAGFVGYRFFFGDADKKEIRNIIEKLEENLEYQKVLQPLAVLTRIRRIKPLISEDFEARSKSGAKRTVNLDQIKTGVMMATRKFPMIDILALPAFITVKGKTAEANFKVTIDGRDTAGETFKELFDITLEFKKIDGDWKCSGGSAERETELVE